MSSTTITSGGLVSFAVKVNGSEIPDESRVLSIEIDKGTNRIPIATITLLDGDVEEGTFDESSSSTFVPGNEITVEAGYDTKNKLIFQGIITRQSIQIDNNVGSVLHVECRDKAVKMIVGRKNLTFSKQKDSAIISQIIGTYSGISANVASTTVEWPEQVQYYTTDWDFILARAEANGMIVNADSGKVSVNKPDDDTTSVLTVTYGDNMYEFNAELNAVNQLNAIKASNWDYTTQKVADASSNTSHTGPGNLSTKKLSEVVGLAEFDLQTSGYIPSNELTTWTAAQHVKSDYAKIRGEVMFQGSSIPTTGKYLTLGGVGDRFNGDHLISGVRHIISDGNWMTYATIGLSDQWFTEQPDVIAPPAAGLLPGVSGLMNATVKKMESDPDSQYRILLDIPLFDPKGEGIWARLANFYSTAGAGAFFLPEVGDEVVIGFLNEDPRYPVILGSLYSATKNKPFDGLTPAENNPKKAIVSKSGIQVLFDDENKVLTLVTPAKNTIVVSDQDQQISIKDQNENSIVMSSSGIEMKSPKDITIDATGTLNLKGMQGINVESSAGDVQLKGLNVKANADIELSAEGGASASVQGGAELTLKGAMVMIN